MFGIYYTTMLINLKKDEEELWTQIGGLRTDVKKGIKNNIKIKLNPSQNELTKAKELYLVMMKNKYLPVEKDYNLENNDKYKVIVAKKDDKVVSFIQFQLFSNIDRLGKTKICALGTISSDYEYTKYAANTLLYREGIKYMKKLEFEYLNFNGISYQYAENEFYTLAKYKRKRGGLEIQIFSQKNIFSFFYWKYLRKYIIIKKITYKILTTIYKNKYFKY